MSYNIDTSEYLSGGLTIQLEDVLALRERFKKELPESNLIEQYALRQNAEGSLDILSPLWSGTYSGASYESVLPEILRHTKGKAHILFTWEGGDSKTGLIVEDGNSKKATVRTILE